MLQRVAQRQRLLGRQFTALPYASTHPTRQLLDIGMPTAVGQADRHGFPIFFNIHGGGWQAGSRTLTPGSIELDTLAHGVAVVSVDYRLSGDGGSPGSTPYPAQIYDVKAALRWIKANARRFHLDPGRIVAFGDSAGGHLAMHLATTPGVPSMTDLTLGNPTMDESVSAVVTLFAPSVFNQHDTDFAAQVSTYGGPASGRGTICSTSTQESWLLGGQSTPINPCSATAEVHNRSDSTYWIANGTAFGAQRRLQGARIMHGVRSGGVGGDAAVAIGQSQRVKAAMEARGITFSPGTAWHYEEVPQADHGTASDPIWESATVRNGIRDWILARAFA